MQGAVCGGRGRSLNPGVSGYGLNASHVVYVCGHGATTKLQQPSELELMWFELGGVWGEARTTWQDTGYQHLALVGGMASWHHVGPLRGLLLIPVTLRDESRRRGSRRRRSTAARIAETRRDENCSASLQTERVAGWTSQGPFGSPLPRRCTCRRGA